MSFSRFQLGINFSMLDSNNGTCNREYDGTSGGHTTFKTMIKTKVKGPGPNTFESPDYSRAETRKRIVDDFIEWITWDNCSSSRRTLEVLVNILLKDAEKHCREVHGKPVALQPDEEI